MNTTATAAINATKTVLLAAIGGFVILLALCAGLAATGTMPTDTGNGVCASFGPTLTQCAPITTHGTPRVEEDGTATYPDGTTYTPEDTHTSPMGCWDEPNVQMPGGFEHLCGMTGDAPQGSVNFTAYPSS